MDRISELLPGGAKLSGFVAPGFEGVVEAFRANFLQRQESGAAVSAWVKDQCVVDLYGGWQDARTHLPWQPDTMVPVFSTTKGVAGLVLAHAASRGLFDYDEPVGLRWPQFAINGKAGITVAQLLAHRAGLVVLDFALDVDLLCNDRRQQLEVLLARQKPMLDPGRYAAYHILTWGLYVNAWFRRMDPQGRTISEYFAQELAGPLGLDFYFRRPTDTDVSTRMARIIEITWRNALPKVPHLAPGMGRALAKPWSLITRAVLNLRGFSINDPAWQCTEFSSAIGFGAPRSLARLYGLFASNHPSLGLSPEVLHRLGQGYPYHGELDQVMRMHLKYGYGFMKPGGDFVFGTDGRAYGMPGLGGSFSFADPATGLGYSYAMTRMNAYPANDPRERALREAVLQALGTPHQEATETLGSVVTSS